MNSPISRRRTRKIATGIALLGGLGLSLVAGADGSGKPRPADPAWQEECGSCHVAYPPRMLPAESWRRLMASLDDHFGSDASIDPARAATVEAFLVANARKSKSGTAPEGGAASLRLTGTKWFRREHDDIRAAKWSSPAIRSPANCGACHRGADLGRFDEDDIRIP